MTPRYSRQTVLPEIGEAGQRLLGKAKVLVLGAGGLGSPALLYLVAAGVGLAKAGGCIGIMDDDRVDDSNLQRQVLYREVDQGLLKVDRAVAQLAALNHETALVAHHTRLGLDNVLSTLSQYDVIVDGTDNFSTKYLINDAAVQLGKPVVYGSIVGFEGQVSTFWGAHGPCYRCLYPKAPCTHVPNCAEAGTLGGVAGLVGSMQAIEACKLALGLEFCRDHGLELLMGQLLMVDARYWDIRKLALEPITDCPVCGVAPEDIQLVGADLAACTDPVVQTISQHELVALLASGAVLNVLDVRELSEWGQGHLEGAIHVPLGQILADVNLPLTVTPTAPLFVYCQHGARSARAVAHLRRKGYEAIRVLVDWAA